MVKVDGMDIMEGVSGNFMIARLRDPGEFIETSLWTRYLDGEESGVSLVIGKLLSDPEGGEVKQAYRFDKMSGWDTTKVMAWLTSRKINFTKPDELLEFASLKDIQIFATGKWNGHTITKKILDGMVDTFKAIGSKVQPYLKLGHNEEQTLLQKDGLPAAGWVTNLKRVGETLVADFADVPKVIADLIEKKAYKRISSEVYSKYEDGDGTRYANVLRAVALLGGDTPAVNCLADVVALYAKADSDTTEKFEFGFDDFINTKGDMEMTEQELQAKLDEQKVAMETKYAADKAAMVVEFEQKITDAAKATAPEADKYKEIVSAFEGVEDLKKFITDLKEKEATMANTTKKYTETIEAARKAEIKSFVDKMVAENRMIPAHSDMVEKMLFALDQEETVLEFTKAELFGLKEKSTLAETLRAFISSTPNMGMLKEFTSLKALGTDGVDKDATRIGLVKKYQEENKVSFGDAQVAIQASRPDLFSSLEIPADTDAE